MSYHGQTAPHTTAQTVGHTRMLLKQNNIDLEAWPDQRSRSLFLSPIPAWDLHDWTGTGTGTGTGTDLPGALSKILREQLPVSYLELSKQEKELQTREDKRGKHKKNVWGGGAT